MTNDQDDFDGINVSGRWGGVHIGSRREGLPHGDHDRGDAEYRRVRRRVRQRLDFYRHAATYALVVGGLALLDWATGDDWWVQWVAIIWGAFVGLQFLSTFVSPTLWGRDVEERMVRRELERRRGRVTVTRPDDRAE